MDNQITNKLWIIKSFWNIYLQDNYHFKDLNIKKKRLIFKIRIKNASRCNSRLKNPKKKESKLDQNSNASLAPKRACRHSWSADCHMASADWPKSSTWPGDPLLKIKPIFFRFLEIRTCVPICIWSLSAYFLSIPTFINRGKKNQN